MKNKIKSVGLFFGQSLIFILGILGLVGTLYDLFENQFTFTEISITEAMFFAGFFFLCHRHYRICRDLDLKVISSIYLPIRNIGWLFLVQLIFLILILIIFGIFSDEDLLALSVAEPYEKINQFIQFLLIFIAIYFASPKQKIKSVQRETVSEITGEKQ